MDNQEIWHQWKLIETKKDYFVFELVDNDLKSKIESQQPHFIIISKIKIDDNIYDFIYEGDINEK